MIDRYLDKIKRLGVQSYYGCFCYAQGIDADNVLTNKIPNFVYIQWITEKHRVFRQEHNINRMYSAQEKKDFVDWLKKEVEIEREIKDRNKW